VLEHTLSEEEHSQIVQTIDMFEAIARTQPDDYQSLEILKEAYNKIGSHDEGLRISRKLAEAYFNVGSYSLAMQECEVVLVEEPNAPEILAMLGEIEQRLQAAGHTIAINGANGAKNGLIARSSYLGEKDGSLIELSRAGNDGGSYNLHDRGDEQLAKFLIVQQLFTEDEVNAGLDTVATLNKNLSGKTLAASLLDKLCRAETEKLDQVLSSLIDRTKAAFVPLEYYDIDRQVVRMLADHLTLGRLFVPFDLISRTIMVACCNPFDAAGRAAVQQSLDYTVTWYIARPSSILKLLHDTYRLGEKA